MSLLLWAIEHHAGTILSLQPGEQTQERTECGLVFVEAAKAAPDHFGHDLDLAPHVHVIMPDRPELAEVDLGEAMLRRRYNQRRLPAFLLANIFGSMNQVTRFLKAVEQGDSNAEDDAVLRDRVLALLKAHDLPGHVLDRPVNGDPDQTAGYAPTSEQPGAVIAGRYKLLEEIVQGGWGRSGRPRERKQRIRR